MAVLIQLTACSSGGRAPIINRDNSGREVPATYRVKPRDTLYSIAWNYGLDYKQLAAANGIVPPYTIYVGQTLYLQGRAPVATRRQSSAATSARRSEPPPPPDKKPATDSAKTLPAAPAVNTSPGASKPLPPRVERWAWPTSGALLRRFSGSVHKGIDIGGERGDAVYPTAPGRVVYAGAGIVGYGELLIIKHSERYLSAYGHNDRLLVSEGDDVIAGQRVAEKGSTGTNRVKLHFEIRRDGKPIDPLSLLPAR